MNILQILPALDVGGVETGTVDLARYLARHGHKVIVVSKGGRLVKELDAIGARHYNEPAGSKSLPDIIRMVGSLREIIRKEDIEIVHARSRVPALIAYFACKMENKIFIITAHGYYKKGILSSVMGWGRYVIVASNIMARHMVDDFGVPFNRIRLIPRGVDLDRFKFRDPASHKNAGFTIGMVSRITPLKGHLDYIKAASILNRRIPNLAALIVGDAPKEKYREDLELLVKRLGLSRTIEFIPATKDVPSIMHKLDVLVSATTTPEAFGRVIIEAHASGVPVVSTKVGGIVDIIEDGSNGLLCSTQNPVDLADKIFSLYKDRQLWKALAVKARETVEANFNLNKMAEKTLAVYEEALKNLNILVIKISALGDVILSIPSLRAIRSRYPQANIKVLVGIQSREVLDRCPYINDVIVCDFKGRHMGIGGFLSLGHELRKDCFDMIIDLQNNRKSHSLAALSTAPLRYGYDNGRFSLFLNRRIKDDAPYLDPIEHQFRTLKLIDIKPTDKNLELWPSKSDEEEANKLLADGWTNPTQPVVGINIRASSRWVTKNWPARYIAELCDRLAKEFNVRTILTGAKEDAIYADEIARLSRSKPLIAAGKTSIMGLVCLIRRFKVYLTPDSAPMHIASSVGVPFIALFGPTDPERHLSPSANCMVLCKSSELRCIPCYSPSCFKKYACMKKITVDDVLDAMRQFL